MLDNTPESDSPEENEDSHCLEDIQLADSSDGDVSISASELEAFSGILNCLFTATSVDFSHYRKTTVLRRLTRRMELCKRNSYAEYLGYIQSSSEESWLLYNDLLLSYTEFFRDPYVFSALKEKLFPSIIEHRSTKDTIRIWIPGCSTGEEVYSMAISFQEFLQENKLNVNIKAQFFGTDLNSQHITFARTGIYPEKARKNLSVERIEQFFDQTLHGLKVTKNIREMCVFAIQNITQDPPFSNIDLISCRNVLIYFDTAFQETVIPLFHFSLRNHGYLLLGSSETTGRFPGLFTLVDQKINLYSKRFFPSRSIYQFPSAHFSPRIRNTESVIPTKFTNKTEPFELGKLIETILLETFSPPSVLVDSNLTIRQFRGRIFPFLEPLTGEASLKLTRMTGDGLMPELYVAIEEVRKKQVKLKKHNITFKHGDTTSLVDISIIPVNDNVNGELYFLILFEKSPIQNSILKESDIQATVNEELNRLRNELQMTKEHLQAIIEEKDEVNQELWASNEEIQSTNEELQSVNEEMEAAKEELESSNEELISLNEALYSKNCELQISNNFSESIVETAKAIVLVLDSNGIIISINKYTEQLTGYKRDEVIGKSWFDLFIPSRLKKNLNQVLENVIDKKSETSQYENYIVVKDGSERLISWSNSVLKKGTGKINTILSIGMDITEQRNSESALKSSEQKYRNLVETSQDLIWQCDNEGNFTYLNPAWETILGYTLDTMLGKKNSFFQTPETALKDALLFNTTQNDIVVRGHETMYLDKNGNGIHLILNAAAIIDESGKRTGIRGTAHDVTGWKKAEQKYQLLFNEMLDAFAHHEIIYDEHHKPVNYRFLALNPAFERITGLKADETVGKTVLDIFPGIEYSWIETYGKVASTGQPAFFENYFPDLKKYFNITAFRPAENQFTCIFSDITDRKMAEEIRIKFEQQQQQTQRLESLGILAGGIAHDFNNLLGGIFGFIDLSIDECKSTKASQYLSTALATIERARSLTQQLLTFAKGGAPVRNIDDLFPYVQESAQFVLSGSNISCLYDIQKDLWPCNYDKNQIGQVIDNIVINAQQSMPSGGIIELTAKNVYADKQNHPLLKKVNYVKISIKDYGIGIPQEMLPHIFDPFFTTKAKGHGLGLATCYSIVNRHDGFIDVESILGKGSVFHIYLPASTGAKLSKYHESPLKHKGNGIFLVMDDEEVIRSTIEAMLGNFGYSVVCKENGRDTISWFNDAKKDGRPVSGMIFDLTIPGGMGGKETINEIRKIDVDIPVFVSSGYADDPVMSAPAEYGFTASICKPFRVMDLVNLLEKHLKK